MWIKVWKVYVFEHAQGPWFFLSFRETSLDMRTLTAAPPAIYIDSTEFFGYNQWWTGYWITANILFALPIIIKKSYSRTCMKETKRRNDFYLSKVRPRTQGGDHSNSIISNDLNLTPPDTIHFSTHVSGVIDVVIWIEDDLESVFGMQEHI